MRNEFYGDQRDLWKWTIALREAGPGKTILHVAMLRPPKRLRQMPKGIDERVWDFFVHEWECFETEPSRCSRIARLSDQVELVSHPFNNHNRSEYFEHVVTALVSRARHKSFVVLLDPDTGIAESKPSYKHICDVDITTVWNAMRNDDVLLIYQHNAHVEKKRWIAEKKRLVAGATGRPDSHIKDYPHSDVCYFVVGK